MGYLPWVVFFTGYNFFRFGLWVIVLGYIPFGLYSPWVVFPRPFVKTLSRKIIFEGESLGDRIFFHNCPQI